MVVNSAKPPLPKQPPPRVVHASVKQSQCGGAPTAATKSNSNALASIGRDTVDGEIRGSMVAAPPPRHRHRRRTIDSGQPMEPMGLIETDLDTEVTVITSGPNVKTRSLLNLGVEPHHLQICGGGGEHHGQQAGATGPQTARPHKSMEFLLDKQNLKVVEVSVKKCGFFGGTHGALGRVWRASAHVRVGNCSVRGVDYDSNSNYEESCAFTRI